jgi:5-amino-6-(5-phosphoribosylamino)uracil reductase
MQSASNTNSNHTKETLCTIRPYILKKLLLLFSKLYCYALYLHSQLWWSRRGSSNGQLFTIFVTAGDFMISTLVLAMTVDGKIADSDRSAAKFSSPEDFRHLEEQVAQADAVLIGAGTLRIHGTTMRVLDPELIQARMQRGQSPQPIQIVCSRSGNLDPDLKFFRQPVPRWLLTPANIQGKKFDRILQISNGLDIDWQRTWAELAGILGGSEIATTLWEQDLIDEFHLTICPWILGNAAAPTPCDGKELKMPHQLELINHQIIGQEIFLHYQRVGFSKTCQF